MKNMAYDILNLTTPCNPKLTELLAVGGYIKTDVQTYTQKT